MNISKFKKALSIFLAILMVFSALPVTAFAAGDNYGMMEVYNAASSADYHKYFNAVYSVTFCDKIDEAAVAEGEAKNPQFAWDVSADKDRSVMAWMEENAEATAEAGAARYDVYIGAEGGVKANPNSSYIFGYFSALEEVNGVENFKTETATNFFRMFYNCGSLENIDLSALDTSNVTSMREMFLNCRVIKNVNLSGLNTSSVTDVNGMFEDCRALEIVDFSGWDTSNVTNMEDMFKNCYELTELDLSSFDTSKVTTMRMMFYLCKKLFYIYVGDGWTTESILNLSDGVFNCCYAKISNIEIVDDVTAKEAEDIYYSNINPPVSNHYAAFEEDGGYLTKAYNVEYKFEGDIPESATAPEKVLYPIGVGETVTVTVENIPAAVEGYTFSGWSTEDADISTGSFELQNDVLIVGTWEKIPEYTVTYVYEGDVPKNAPECPEAKTYYVGTTVTVAYEPECIGYTFSGWSTEDADITTGSFELQNDVVIVGKWEKITAENIEVKIEGSEDDSYIELEPGDTTKFEVTVKPEGVSDKDVTFESSDETVVKVDEDGNVTAVGEGTAVIKITSKDNEEIYVVVDVKVEYTRYKVTYAYEGEVIPENAPEVPGDVSYIEGETVKVETAPTADGYVFSGWSTDDATVKKGEFVINNDVDFVGSWKKVYNVYYRYDDRYPVPEGAMALPEEGIAYEVGSEVELTGVMYVPEHVFIGWYTEDVEISGDMFEMPENDVVLYGYFKKPVESIEFIVEEDTLTLSPEDSENLSKYVYIRPDDATIKDIIFESSDESVVKVDENGVITPVSEGTATVTVKSADDPTKNDTITVEVKKPVTSITVDKSEFTLYVDDTAKVTGTVNSDATNKSVIYESVDPTIAEVDENGNITAKKEGTTTITVKSADNPSFKEEVTVTVKNPVTEIIAEDELEVLIDDTIELGASVNGDATEKGLIYESSDDEIAKVSADGVVLGGKEGTVTITVTSVDNPEVKKEIKVTVYKKYKVTYLYDDNYELPENAPMLPETVEYKAGESVTVANLPSVEDYVFVGWTTDDAEVVSNKFSMPEKDVTLYGYFKIPVSGIEIEGVDKVNLAEGTTHEIIVKVTPESATNKGVKYTSSNPDVAEVDENGKVTAKEPGKTTITVISEDNEEKTVEIEVVVVKQYKVTYAYVGEVIPEEHPAIPEETKHTAGTTVKVENKHTADGYVFSGWSTEDADVKNGSFTINNDVHFVGSWTKLYKVTYEYEGDVPENAPGLPVEVKYAAGEEVDVETVPLVDGYTFTGWYTVDADVEDGKFTMPTKDVVLKGKFEKIINYYNVTYKYEGEIPEGAPVVPDGATYEEGTEVTVEKNPSLKNYTFSGWSTNDAEVENGKFIINNDVEFVGSWEKIPVTGIVAKDLDIKPGRTSKIIFEVKPDTATDKSLTFESGDETVARVDDKGNVTAIKEGTATITIISKDNPEIKTEIKVTVYNEYTVTYKFKNKAPEGVKLPEKATYRTGDEVTVAAAPYAPGYIFSGWSTDDADITSGKFNIYNDVVIEGEWTEIKYYKVEYVYEGEVPDGAPKFDTVSYKEGTTVTVETVPTIKYYAFSGWSTEDAVVKDGKFIINNDVKLVGKWSLVPGPVEEVYVPDDFTMILGEETVLEASVNKNAINKGLTYESLNPDIATVDENGNIKTVAEGKATIRVRSADKPEIYADVVITVTTSTGVSTTHYIVFGKTEKIGWYRVSMDGGETFFTQFGNDHLEVQKGTELIVKAVDVFGDPFTFYINGEAATPDENGYVHILVDRFILIGALGIPVVAPDAEESMTFFQQLIQKIKDFFAKIASWFKF